MANAGFGLPLPYTIASFDGPVTRPWSNVTNDEPGLVVVSPVKADDDSTFVMIDVDSDEDISFLALLGVNIAFDVSVSAYTSDANRTSNTDPLILTSTAGGEGSMSANRSGLRRGFYTFPATDRKFLTVSIINRSGGASTIEMWRLLVGKWISPADNIEVPATAKIDDRQNRRYGQNGRRNFQNIGVWPAFTGQWPWISQTEYKTMIKPMMLKYGASRPVVFCLDYEDTDWGEDDLYYGDLEKDQAIDLGDGQLYAYQFSIVDIAPIAATL